MRPEFDIASNLLRSRLIGIVRSATPVDLVECTRALHSNGVCCVEITINTPGALAAIERIRADLPAECLIGAGTVLDADTAAHALSAGAQFVVTPIVDAATITFVRQRGVAIMPGAYTPTEIYTAWRAGATIVKLFPANHLGPHYVREVLAPLPELRLCPTGGVTLSNAAEWFAAGASALGVGSALMPRAALESGNWEMIGALAKSWAQLIATSPTAAPHQQTGGSHPPTTLA